MIEIALKKPQIRLLLKVLDGPSVTDPKAAELYEGLKRMLDEAAPTFPWRTVTQSSEGAGYRNGLRAAPVVNLKLECGHVVRETGGSHYEMKRRLDRGETIKRRCSECAGGPPRRANP